MKRYLILIGCLLVPLIPLGLYALGVIKPPVRHPETVPLTVWVVTEGASAYQALIADYNAVHPYVKISVEQIPEKDYASRLKDAWARGQGPDVFALPSSWIGEFSGDFLFPLPQSVTVYSYQNRKILIKTTTSIQKTTLPSLTVPQLQKNYVDVVSDDVIRNNRIYGLPLSVDTLAMYYNKDLLRSANIVEPPTTWTQLADLMPKLTITDKDGTVLQSGLPIGTGKNVAHASDIISLLFLQDGVKMQTPDGSVLLDSSVTDDGRNLGENALLFYTSFANPKQSTYSWNADQPESRDAFLRGKTALYLGYASDQDIIEQGGSVNFGISPIPHLSTDGKDAMFSTAGVPLQVTYGNYWVLSVFQRTPHPDEAWNFIQYIANPSKVSSFLTATHRISALRSIIRTQQEDPNLSIFAQQAVSARSWYHGRSAVAVENNLRAMLDNVSAGKMTAPDALTLARKQIELTTKGQ